MKTHFKLHRMDRTRSDSARLRSMDFKQLRQMKRERMEAK
jgi:hypothetical protein